MQTISLCYFYWLSSKRDLHPSKETPFLHIFIPNPLPGLQKALLWRPATGHELQHGTKKRTKVVPAAALAAAPLQGVKTCLSGRRFWADRWHLGPNSKDRYPCRSWAERVALRWPHRKPRARSGIKLAQLQTRGLS